ncbi:hypothetical protein SK128_002583 [Halocaridina rubra]|uniref:Deoxyribodipyrimidine photo-lyase n=1 Tax=Halocaridina rubra TaxID=373956 RepID=A0AAN8XDR2_HALRR
MPQTKDKRKKNQDYYAQGYASGYSAYEPSQHMAQHIPVKRFVPSAPMKEIASVSKMSAIDMETCGMNIHSRLDKERTQIGSSILEVTFHESRVQLLNGAKSVPNESKGIVYWMCRDQRVQDNWAFLFAQRIALKNKLPLHVAFCLVPKFQDATYRHYHFILKGLEEIESECKKLGIEFHLLFGHACDVFPEFIKSYGIGGLVTDFSPLRVPLQWVQEVKDVISSTVPIFRVDAHNIIPCWATSDILEYAAYTIRKKVHDKLPTFLTGFPPVVIHPYESTQKAKPINWAFAHNCLEVDITVGPVNWAAPGTKAGLDCLHDFCEKRLHMFEKQSNDPTVNAQSNLSPWLHFGQISPQRVALEVSRYRGRLQEPVNAFLEQITVRRELADNFCFYQKNYDNINGAPDWARNALENHRHDGREYLYSRETLEKASTHDELWNSTQNQLVQNGKIHGYMRMYWAKKILEWTVSPEEAIATAVYLNDRYSLDGCDPNGYNGIMWSVCGVHDKMFDDRPVFGKIRYMSYFGCKKKFSIEAYVRQNGGKKHRYMPSS